LSWLRPSWRVYQSVKHELAGQERRAIWAFWCSHPSDAHDKLLYMLNALVAIIAVVTAAA